MIKTFKIVGLVVDKINNYGATASHTIYGYESGARISITLSQFEKYWYRSAQLCLDHVDEFPDFDQLPINGTLEITIDTDAETIDCEAFYMSENGGNMYEPNGHYMISNDAFIDIK